ncbi:MAG: hypothetical protein HQL06_14590 [Nitrospirae bacterium]|nr:hypothetical protein [Nitrospirota bacterium]
MKPSDLDEDDFELKDEYDFSSGIKGKLYRPKEVSKPSTGCGQSKKDANDFEHLSPDDSVI